MSRFRDVVAAHHDESDAVLVASREPCISVAADEAENVPVRSFQVVEPDELGGLDLRATWIAAVLLCPGDDAGTVAAWIQEKNRDPERVLFYFHPDSDEREALSPWHKAGLPVRSVWTVEDWTDLHKHLGAHWNNQVFEDFAGEESQG